MERVAFLADIILMLLTALNAATAHVFGCRLGFHGSRGSLVGLRGVLALLRKLRRPVRHLHVQVEEAAAQLALNKLSAARPMTLDRSDCVTHVKAALIDDVEVGYSGVVARLLLL